MIFKAYVNNKKISLIGIPYCVEQFLYGGFDFIRIKNIFEPINFYFFNRFKELNQRTTQLIECRNCILSNNCEGLGIKKENFNLYNYRIKPEIRALYSSKIEFKDFDFNQLYQNYVFYIKNSNIYKTDRTLRYSRNVILEKGFSNYLDYSNRFIYYARYIDFSELEKEKNFLENNVYNKNFLNFIFNNYKKYFMTGFAYSGAKISKNEFRESYYLYFYNFDALFIFLSNERLNFEIKKYENFEAYFIGIDFRNNLKENNFNLNGYKIYYRILNYNFFIDFLKERIKITSFLDYFIKILNKSSYHLYVERYDSKNKLNSIKIEFTPKNDKLKEEICKKFNISKSEKFLEIEYFAFEFNLDFDLKKITIYERPKLFSDK